jgi:hypothetical protein
MHHPPVNIFPKEEEFCFNIKNHNMKKIYLVFISILLIAACSKDFLRSYDKRITGGSWELYDVRNFGIGSSYHPVFNSGRFNFESSGQVTYTTNLGEEFTGSWDIREDWSGEDRLQSLFITVTNFQTQQVYSEYFDDIQFTGTNRFKATINSRGRTYTFKFKR